MSLTLQRKCGIGVPPMKKTNMANMAGTAMPLNEKQFKPVKNGGNRPFVVAHFAMTADGKTGTRASTPARFTSPSDKAHLQEIRAGADAVMACRGTVETDSTGLGISRRDLRGDRVSRGLPPVPLRVIISNSGRLDPGSKAFRYSASPIVVFSTRRMPERLRAAIARNADLFLFPAPSVDLRKALEILRAEFGVKRLVCEGDGNLLRSLASLDLVDRICLTVAPVIFGGHLAPTLTGLPGGFLDPPREFEIVWQSVHDGECRLELARKKRGT